MARAKRARKAETPKQPSLGLMLRASYFYPTRVYALNLNRSPEKGEFWVWAEPLPMGAGYTGGTLKTSANRPPGVADSIELYNGR